MQVIGLILLTGVALCSAQQGAYQQCGGTNWTGGTTCVAGWACVPQAGNPYYSQCLAVSTTITSSTPSAVVDTTQQSPYAQCGGINWTGGTTCIAGWTCVPQAGNPYYSQCLPASSSSSTVKAAATTSSAKTVVATTSSTTTRPAATSASSSSSSAAPKSTAPASSGGVTYKSSFTFYGAGDTFGSPNCQTDTSACGFFTSPGFAAAASQNLFGVGPGAGAGPACGTCWQLTGQTDSSGKALSNAGTSIIVMVNNLCPAEGNPLCAQSGLTGTNQYGANVNFDLCEDSGARAAFFGNDGVGLALGTATQVSCSLYSGLLCTRRPGRVGERGGAGGGEFGLVDFSAW